MAPDTMPPTPAAPPSTAALHRDALKLSIQSLQRIYAFIIALAFGIALSRFFEAPANGDFSLENIATRSAFILVSFFATAIPFFHGMNRHLDDLYALDRFPHKHKRPEPFDLFLDLFVFVIEACILYLLALAIEDYKTFYKLLGALLIVDLIWSFVTWRLTGSPAIKWAIINVIFGPAILLLCYKLTWPELDHLMLLASVAVARTVVDYWLNWKFYFPKS